MWEKQWEWLHVKWELCLDEFLNHLTLCLNYHQANRGKLPNGTKLLPPLPAPHASPGIANQDAAGLQCSQLPPFPPPRSVFFPCSISWDQGSGWIATRVKKGCIWKFAHLFPKTIMQRVLLFQECVFISQISLNIFGAQQVLYQSCLTSQKYFPFFPANVTLALTSMSLRQEIRN